MAQGWDIAPWIMLFMGLYALAASAGEFRQPGHWAALLDDLERSPAARFAIGLLTLTIGALIYLANPWRPGDWIAMIVSVLGAFAIVEGALLLASGDRFLAFARKLLGRGQRGWAGFGALAGAAMLLAAFSRL